MDNWDSEKLHKVIAQNQKKYSGRNETRNVCNHFLRAVENNKYGWFWDCPNGSDCMYRHCLPPGYILKKDRKKMQEFEDDEVAIEERIEEKRSKIFMKGNGTKVCKETLIALWAKFAKKRELKEKKELKARKAR
jgi:ssDNA-binding Zn-finger/Zn-ribbon topoisomerase 1